MSSALLSSLGEYTHKLWSERAQKREKDSGKKVIDLGKGTPDIPPSALYMERLREHLSDQKAHFYPGYTPSPVFAVAMSDWYQGNDRGALRPSEIAVVSGAKDAIMHLPFAFLNDGDRCLVPDPGYPPFSQSLTIAGALPVPYEDFDDLLSLLSTKPKAVWVNSPCNPTGALYTREELTEIIATAQRYDVMVWYDAAYIDITYDGIRGISIFEIPGAPEVALEIGSFSKSHSFAGLRIGWVAGNEKFIQPFLRMKSFFDSGVSLPIQYMTADALYTSDTLWHQNALDLYARRRDDVIHLLQPYFPQTIQKPSAALYLWIPIPAGYTSESFTLMMLEKNNILLTPGTAFGHNGEGFVRASFSTKIGSI